MGTRFDAGTAVPAARLPVWTLSFARSLYRAMAYLVRLHERSRQRVRLMELDDRMLQDIGLSRDDVRRESRPAFWEG